MPFSPLFDDDDPRRVALVLRLNGWPNDRIAQEMGTTEEIVARWAAEAGAIIERSRAENPERLHEILETARPRYTAEQRRDDARSLLDPSSGWGPAVRVTESGREGWDYNVSFNDLASSTFADLVTGTMEVLRADHRVREALHEDRELILVAARRLNRKTLEKELRTWWNERLREVMN